MVADSKNRAMPFATAGAQSCVTTRPMVKAVSCRKQCHPIWSYFKFIDIAVIATLTVVTHNHRRITE